MYSISKKINIRKKALVAKTTFTNDEIIPSAVTAFTCCDCSHENAIEIVPYQSGFPILQIYENNKVLSKNELLINAAVTETSQGMSHFGELTVNNLPTLYFGTDCSSCHSKYICVFSYGEKQPGLTILTISGVWKYEELE
ncbi:hypothetical protein CEY12_03030 [Chryseobacterium sp. T16E-39]|uniref:hypothetical protein n=1 Tax=Chryseobacterium sp. T16E-39 TaxID=2015076 RepID=UPI000B5B163C|nr:hypothetical protein [Chryseobacterium sp. T16E-39]ASK29141.1 hypothetical protein CEY12_03030 [Chryseobacterium sp. T16E-39]